MPVSFDILIDFPNTPTNKLDYPPLFFAAKSEKTANAGCLAAN